jgi:hypothetical protein
LRRSSKFECSLAYISWVVRLLKHFLHVVQTS